ncbi:hypothetical protein PYJP_12360 [Pyrofollis japonicus]|uniref:DUF432 domain-containing protein n=1 Tax=Pyrofollis japonicus TaxID=3060460 RepID=UPI00295BE809|nr:DUF432 domain-containing protein [Pyrofollis japonicus]BEP17884.1 hypothetical protein PYJP_12360 [Pyrofollis japonicus]
MESQHFVVLRRGDSRAIGECRLAYSVDGVFEFCDPFGCRRALLTEHDTVYADLVPPLYRPQPLTSCIYLEFSDPVIIGAKTTTLWATAPYELLIHVNDTAIAYVSPFKVKYTLVGDVIDGTVCRHHRSRAWLSLEEALRSAGIYALVRIDVSGVEGIIPGIGFNAALTELYIDDEGRLFYPILVARREPRHVAARLSSERPLAGVRRVWQASRKLRVPITSPAFITPIPSP